MQWRAEILCFRFQRIWMTFMWHLSYAQASLGFGVYVQQALNRANVSGCSDLDRPHIWSQLFCLHGVARFMFPRGGNLTAHWQRLWERLGWDAKQSGRRWNWIAR
jgi:hypothetical protein